MPQPPFARGSVPFRVERVLYLLAVLLNAIPIWLADFPPMIDIPQHASQVATYFRLADPTYPLNSILETNLFTPYLLGYLLIMAFVKMLPMTAAIKVVLSLAIIAFPLACSALRRESGGNPLWDWLAIPAAYSFSFNWGFLNFVVGAPLAILYLALCFHHMRAPSSLTRVGLFLGTLVLFLAHAMLFVVFGGIGAVLIVIHAKGWRERAVNLTPMLLALPLAVAWLFANPQGGSEVSSSITWDQPWGRLLWLLSEPYAWLEDLEQAIGAVLLILAAPFLMGGRLARDWKKFVPFVLFLGIYLLLPDSVLDVSLIYPRFEMFLIPIYLTAISYPAAQSASRAAAVGGWTMSLAGLLIAAGVAAASVKTYAERYKAFDDDSQAFLRILEKMEPEKRVLSLMFNPDSPTVPLAYLHFPAWYQALKGGLVEANFSASNHMVTRYRPDYRPATHLGLELDPWSFDWSLNRGWEYDYFVMRLSTDQDTDVLRDADCPIRLIAREGAWSLYRREWGQADDARSCARRHRKWENRLVFSNVQRSADFDTDEKQFEDLNFNVSRPLGHALAHWRPVQAPRGSSIELDLAASRAATDFKTTYVYAEVDAGATSAVAMLLLGSDDGLTVWHDGKEVSKQIIERAATLGDDRVELSLHPGVNTLVFRVNNASGGWYLLARID